MKIIKFIPLFPALLLICCLPAHAQTSISRVWAEVENRQIVVHYTLVTQQPADVTLQYSMDNGNAWFDCQSISGHLQSQTSGDKTIVWDCLRDGYTQGSVLFKVSSLSDDTSVVINGVRWAICNVDKPGAFTAKPEDVGMFYQWNRKTAWPATGNITRWDNSDPAGNRWEKINDPSPVGWHVPTVSEIRTLYNADKVSNEWITLNGVAGEKFTDKATGHAIFLPAAGYLDYYGGVLRNSGSYGRYWSSTMYDSNSAYNLGFYEGNVNRSYWGSWYYNGYGFNVRPVAD